MMRIESNIDLFMASQKRMIANLRNADKVLRQGAFDSVALISDRIQQQGKKTDGSPITTKSEKKFNAYSYQYGKFRTKKGRETDHIDMTFTGDMMGDLLPVKDSEKSYIVGFRGKHSSDKAQFNEQRFGKLFNLSSGELKVVGDVINESISAIINNRS